MLTVPFTFDALAGLAIGLVFTLVCLRDMSRAVLWYVALAWVPFFQVATFSGGQATEGFMQVEWLATIMIVVWLLRRPLLRGHGIVRTSFDTPLLLRHLNALLEGGSVDEPIWDFTSHRRLQETRRIGGSPVVVLEGILILAFPELRDLMDIKVYVETDPDIRLLRRLRRDVEERGRTVASVLHQYEHSVRPMHLQFVEQSKRYADLIIPEGGYNRVAVDLLKTKIAAVLMQKWPEPWRGSEEEPKP